MSRFAAVFFDMDGTLFDTEIIYTEIKRDFVRSFGGQFTDEMAAQLMGHDFHIQAGFYTQWFGVPMDAERLIKNESRIVDYYIDKKVQWRPGAKDLLADLSAHSVPLALVTTARRAIVNSALENMEAHYFNAIITGDDVVNCKPHSEPYLRAAEFLSVKAADCFVVEDTTSGVASAEAAGCAVIAVPLTGTIPQAPRRIVRNDLSDTSVAWLIEQWNSITSATQERISID